jgi:hypothetical protein
MPASWVCHLLRGPDVLLQVQARSIDHDRLIAGGNGALDQGHVVDPLVVLVDHRYVIQVQPHVLRVGPPGVFLGDRFDALALELLPLDAGNFDQGE